MRKWKHALLALAMGVLVLLSFLPVDAKASEGADGSDMISRYDFDEIDSMLEEIFPREQLGFKETLMGILSGDLDFSLQLLGELEGGPHRPHQCYVSPAPAKQNPGPSQSASISGFC